MSRLASRLHVLPRALLRGGARRVRPTDPRRILIAHDLLLGDTLMLAALLARLRRLYPRAQIDMTVKPAFLPLFAQRPYGVDAVPFDPHHPGLTRGLTRRGPYDLALIPGDNRFCLLARAAGARWIVALADDQPQWKNRAADELIAWPTTHANLADMFASLAGPGDEVYARTDWPTPPCPPYDAPDRPYAVLHVGAGSPLRYWPAQHWLALAQALAAQGITPIWSAGEKEVAQVSTIDPQGQFPSLAGKLNLAQLWHLVEGARLLVVPDTGISHLAKLTGTPTVCLYGPGSDVLFGAGRFWREHRFAPAIVADFPCRDQRSLFKRELDWVRRCQRGLDRCPAPACMHALEFERVLQTCRALLG